MKLIMGETNLFVTFRLVFLYCGLPKKDHVRFKLCYDILSLTQTKKKALICFKIFQGINLIKY